MENVYQNVFTEERILESVHIMEKGMLENA